MSHTCLNRVCRVHKAFSMSVCPKTVSFPDCPRSSNERRHCGVILPEGFFLFCKTGGTFSTRQCRSYEPCIYSKGNLQRESYLCKLRNVDNLPLLVISSGSDPYPCAGNFKVQTRLQILSTKCKSGSLFAY